MKVRKTILSVLSLVCAAVLLRGCGSREYSAEEAEEYFSERYGGSFTFISKTEYTQPSTEPVTDTNGSAVSVYTPPDDKTYYFTDADGVRFSMDYEYLYGCSSHYQMTDDYCVQWLYSKPELYDSLLHSELDCGIDMSGNVYGTLHGDCGFSIYVDDMDDVEKACELAYSVVSNDEAILPDKGTRRTDADLRSVKPVIRLVTPEGENIREMNFRTKECPIATDIDIFTYLAQCSYLSAVPDTGSDPVYEFKSLHIYSGKKELSSVFTKGIGSVYMTDELSSEEERLWFSEAAEICEAAGYKVKRKGKNKMQFKKDGTKVVMKCEKGLLSGSVKNFTITKNGSIYVPEGKARASANYGCYLDLTTADYTELFGIHFEYDFKNGTAKIV